MTHYATNSTSMMRPLILKDMRQILPLIGICAVLGTAICLVLHFLMPHSINANAIILGIPGLLAVGLGSLLISLEKDLGTMLWLRRLPIRRQQLLLAKLGAAGASLTLTWLLSLAIWSILAEFSIGKFNPSFSPEGEGSLTTLTLWILNSAYITLAGIAISWRTQSSLVGLLLLTPWLIFPWLSYGLVFSGLGLEDWQADIALIVLFLLCALIAGRLSWTYGLSYLNSTQSRPRLLGSGLVSDTRVGAGAQATSSRNYLSRRPLSPDLSMLRQYWTQNRTAYFGILGLFAMSTLLAFITPARMSVERYQAVALVSCLLLGLGACWLGVLSFHGDRARNRVRFLADRGLSPWKTWLTRHLIPCITLLLVALVVTHVHLPFSDGRLNLGLAGHATAWLCILGVLLATYGFAQWAAQLIPYPIIACLVAPLATLVACGCILLEYLYLCVPVVGISLIVAIPYLATATSMKRWMDSVARNGFYQRHAAWLACILAISVAPFAYYAATAPTMPASRIEELQSLAQGYRGLNKASIHYGPSLYRKSMETELENIQRKSQLILDDEQTRETFAETLEWNTQQNRNYDAEVRKLLNDLLPTLNANSRDPVVENMPTPVRLLNSLRFARNDLEKNETDEARQYYRESVRNFIDATTLIRHFHTLLWQSHADQGEAILLRELQRPRSRELLGEAIFQDGITLLSQSQQRDRSRRAALAVTWDSYPDRTSRQAYSRLEMLDTLGGYEAPAFYPSGSLPWWCFTGRQMNTRVVHLLELLETHNRTSAESQRAVVARDWGWPVAHFDVNDIWLSDLTIDRSEYPGMYWRDAWEYEAAEFVQIMALQKPSNQDTNRSE